MISNQKMLKISLILTDIFILLLLFIMVLLPYGVTWYVEVMNRSETLPATVMVTCYSCAPFLGISLLSLRAIIKNVISQKLFDDKNHKHIRNISICSLIISVITLIAGKFYLPFFIVAGTFAFIALMTFVAMTLFKSAEDLTKLNQNN